jgi:hypothetical protein
VSKIASKYPQALYYPFKVLDSLLEIDRLSSSNQQNVSPVFQYLQQKFAAFEMLNSWVEALDCLMFPELRFKHWHQLVCDAYQDPLLQQNQELMLQKIRRTILLMYADIMTDSKQMVKQGIGLYNKQFIDKY